MPNLCRDATHQARSPRGVTASPSVDLLRACSKLLLRYWEPHHLTTQEMDELFKFLRQTLRAKDRQTLAWLARDVQGRRRFLLNEILGPALAEFQANREVQRFIRGQQR